MPVLRQIVKDYASDHGLTEEEVLKQIKAGELDGFKDQGSIYVRIQLRDEIVEAPPSNKGDGELQKPRDVLFGAQGDNSVNNANLSDEDRIQRIKEKAEIENQKIAQEDNALKSSVDDSEKSANDSMFSFHGRINRADYWINLILLIFISLLLFIGMLFALDSGSIVFRVLILIFNIPLAWAVIANYVKRWHDINMSGWMAVTMLIPYMNLLVVIFLGLVPGSTGLNNYGKEPE